MAHFTGGKGLDLMEHGTPHVPAQGHGGAGAEVDRPYGTDHLHQGHGQHDPTRAQDVARVPRYDTVVDYLGVERGQVEVGQRL